jgi:outer membrane PBP1 activator LpoA protein
VSANTTDAPLAPPRIALILPLRSDTLGRAAEAVRAGFQAAWERDRGDATLTVIETGDSSKEILSVYAEAVAGHDIVVGPLSRTDVTALALSRIVNIPTIALTQPDISIETDGTLPRNLLVIGLSLEDEARQAARWAGSGKKSARALVLSTTATWQRRAAHAFAGQWQQAGFEAQSIELPTSGGYFSANAIALLKKRIQSDKPTLLFLALDAAQARQLRSALGSDLPPMYGLSQLNPLVPQDADSNRLSELDGIRLLDLPWQIALAHPAVMIYPRLLDSAEQKRSADLERLYALGIDAFRIAREIGQRHTDFDLDGVSGKLHVSFGNGATRFERTALQAVYRDGVVVPLNADR